jgi:hypothetical protein
LPIADEPRTYRTGPRYTGPRENRFAKHLGVRRLDAAFVLRLPTPFIFRVSTFRSAGFVPQCSKSDKKAADFRKKPVLLHKMSFCFAKMSLFCRANCRRFICFHTDSGFDRD